MSADDQAFLDIVSVHAATLMLEEANNAFLDSSPRFLMIFESTRAT